MHVGLRSLGADIREIPDYCFATTWSDPRSWFRLLLSSCSDYTQAELEAMTASQMTQACTGPDGIVDFTCRQAGIEAARASEASATSSEERQYAGTYMSYVVGAIAVVAALIVLGKGRR